MRVTKPRPNNANRLSLKKKAGCQSQDPTSRPLPLPRALGDTLGDTLARSHQPQRGKRHEGSRRKKSFSGVRSHPTQSPSFGIVNHGTQRPEFVFSQRKYANIPFGDVGLCTHTHPQTHIHAPRSQYLWF